MSDNIFKKLEKAPIMPEPEDLEQVANEAIAEQQAEPEPTEEELAQQESDYVWECPGPRPGQIMRWTGPMGGSEWRKWKSYVARHAWARD